MFTGSSVQRDAHVQLVSEYQRLTLLDFRLRGNEESMWVRQFHEQSTTCSVIAVQSGIHLRRVRPGFRRSPE